MKKRIQFLLGYVSTLVIIFSQVQAAGADSRLQNLASRGFVGTGDKVLIGGLVISGTEPVENLRKPLLTRR